MRQTIAKMGIRAFIAFVTVMGAPLTMYNEGVKLEPYFDKIANKVTWCAGETEVGYQEHFTFDQCSVLFKIRYGYFSTRVAMMYNQTGRENVTPEMHAAFTDTAYNIGLTGFQKSSMLRNANQNRPIEACNSILLYKKAGGYDCSTPGNKICPGVWDRRKRMHNLCLSGAK